ncbi:MAG: HipA domain-containing protein [Flavobacteriales bacterium]|nr:HipA domain-containing protein [Flavobacteriales bacterium]
MKCLICYKPLTPQETDYHVKCIARVFGVKQIPEFDIDEKKLSDYAKKIIGANRAITGVQPKLSLWLEETKKSIRFTIVNDKSNYIIKPQSETYLSLPENEDLCMHLANELGIEVAIHSLVRLKSGKLAYITKRFDRDKTNKISCEDLCQLTETLTEHKYRGSYEKVGKTITQYSTQSGLDILHYFQLVLFSFISGNADMHLKNFSMMEKKDGTFCLSPAYDLVSTHLVIKGETEQMSLNLNGKKNKISRKDFDALGLNLKLTEKQIQNCYNLFINRLDKLNWWIDNSFLPTEHKIDLKKMVSERIELLVSS